MPASGHRQIGINEAGYIDGGTDTPFGDTQQEGVVVQLSTDVADLQGGQAKVLEDRELVSANMEIQIMLVEAALQAVQELYGLPSGNFSGDLDTSTQEEVQFDNNLGTVETGIYALGPGPASTRRVEASRCKIGDLGDLTMASDSYMLPQATWTVLKPDSGASLLIQDAP